MGEKFQPFRLPDLQGNLVALEDFRGKQVLVVNWSPNCGYCARVAPEISKFKDAFRAHNVELALISYGDAEANQKLASEHGLEGAVLLRQDATPVEPFENFGTPVAYLLNEEGEVAKPIIIGADRVPVLARYAIGEATETELARKPTKQSICGQIAKDAPKSEEIRGTGPGAELKRLLAKLGIAVTADCPCNERAALMDRNGWAWCEQNIQTIVGWMGEESARRGTIFVEFGARFLVKRAIAKARRSGKQMSKSDAGIIPGSGARSSA